MKIAKAHAETTTATRAHNKLRVFVVVIVCSLLLDMLSLIFLLLGGSRPVL